MKAAMARALDASPLARMLSRKPYDQESVNSGYGEDAPPPAAATKNVNPLSRLRAAVLAVMTSRRRRSRRSRLGSRLTGTIYGRRRGKVRISFQTSSQAVVVLELASVSTGTLVREMSTGLVRIALECDKPAEPSSSPARLLEEPVWRAYCNGRKCGFAVRRPEMDCVDRRVMGAVGVVSVGAGVLPPAQDGGEEEEEEEEGEMMFMRARFERVVGSKDSEAFYMLSPDGAGGGSDGSGAVPELSIYLLRV